MSDGASQLGAATPASPLFEPFVHGTLRLRNRLVMAPTGRAFTQDGVPAPAYAAYFSRRVEGGIGLIMGERAATAIRRHPSPPTPTSSAWLAR